MREQPDEGAEERRLAGSIGADQRNALASSNLERDIVKDWTAAKSHADIASIEKRGGVGHGAAAAVRSGQTR